MNDIFDKIITREIPASIIYEDDHILAFLDINPINKGHALVIPKVHFRNLLDADEDVLAHLIVVAKKIALGIKAATNADGINLAMNNEHAAGQEIFHAHLHIIPRFEGDEAYPRHRHLKYEDGEMDTFGAAIKNAIH